MIFHTIMNHLKTTVAGVGLLMLTSCNGIFDDIYDQPKEIVPAKGQLLIDATSWTDWYYVDLNLLQRLTEAGDEEALMKAQLYLRKKEAAGDDLSKLPPFDMKLEALIPVLRREIPLKAHAHRADDIFTAIRIAKEFGVRLTLEHVTEGHLIADELAKTGLCMAVGPSLGHATKVEVRNKSWQTPGILSRAGCHVSIITDCTVIPQQYLPLCAGMAVCAGMDPFEALRAITINPAEHIGVADRVGSIEEGKDADIVLTNGNPFEVSTCVHRVLISGKTVYSAE